MGRGSVLFKCVIDGYETAQPGQAICKRARCEHIFRKLQASKTLNKKYENARERYKIKEVTREQIQRELQAMREFTKVEITKLQRSLHENEMSKISVIEDVPPPSTAVPAVPAVPPVPPVLTVSAMPTVPTVPLVPTVPIKNTEYDRHEELEIRTSLIKFMIQTQMTNTRKVWEIGCGFTHYDTYYAWALRNDTSTENLPLSTSFKPSLFRQQLMAFMKCSKVSKDMAKVLWEKGCALNTFEFFWS